MKKANTAKSPTSRAHNRGQHRHCGSKWIPTIQHVRDNGDGGVHANVSWTDLTTAAAIQEVVPVALHKLTLLALTRNFAYDPQLASRHFSRLNRAFGPYTYVRPKSAQATMIEADSSAPALPNGFLVPPVQHLDSIFRRLDALSVKARRRYRLLGLKRLEVPSEALVVGIAINGASPGLRNSGQRRLNPSPHGASRSLYPSRHAPSPAAAAKGLLPDDRARRRPIDIQVSRRVAEAVGGGGDRRPLRRKHRPGVPPLAAAAAAVTAATAGGTSAGGTPSGRRRQARAQTPPPASPRRRGRPRGRPSGQPTSRPRPTPPPHEHLHRRVVGGAAEDAHDALPGAPVNNRARKVGEVLRAPDGHPVGNAVEQQHPHRRPQRRRHVQAGGRRTLLARILKGAPHRRRHRRPQAPPVGRPAEGGVQEVKVFAPRLPNEPRIGLVGGRAAADGGDEAVKGARRARKVDARQVGGPRDGSDKGVGGAGHELDDAGREARLGEERVEEVGGVSGGGGGGPEGRVADKGGGRRQVDANGDEAVACAGGGSTRPTAKRAVLRGRHAKAPKVGRLGDRVNLGLPRALAHREHRRGGDAPPPRVRAEEVGGGEKDGRAVRLGGRRPVAPRGGGAGGRLGESGARTRDAAWRRVAAARARARRAGHSRHGSRPRPPAPQRTVTSREPGRYSRHRSFTGRGGWVAPATWRRPPADQAAPTTRGGARGRPAVGAAASRRAADSSRRDDGAGAMAAGGRRGRPHGLGRRAMARRRQWRCGQEGDRPRSRRPRPPPTPQRRAVGGADGVAGDSAQVGEGAQVGPAARVRHPHRVDGRGKRDAGSDAREQRRESRGAMRRRGGIRQGVVVCALPVLVRALPVLVCAFAMRACGALRDTSRRSPKLSGRSAALDPRAPRGSSTGSARKCCMTYRDQ
ncbi:LOW QUALITY PROTEIN: hypothetical protein BU14_0401s0007 [Porphyra umbilicalis]|uniref:Uncharacterized protein n=1 Tax=Porphyra umbilicalis TaxID=2786 RepID=A0A1X6NWF2_PORUM|nr:LOW QUALITY PROTEIN: hypothetical protein BU14_0401s0007 [Porphyra umbilicalis]|eukprot:OSX72836.1 LOW QUALITY PROTEIN: hypothetical protein BU14_0401s0007 [Porphyra umbilicalis]